MEKHIEDFIIAADAKAFATYGEDTINVVPVSSIKIKDGTIWLINYFMEKTLVNIQNNKNCSLVCWKKMMGYQIKGEVQYITDGQEFEEAVSWIRSILPDRTVKGLIVITPQEIYDISPTKNTREKFLAEQESVVRS